MMRRALRGTRRLTLRNLYRLRADELWNRNRARLRVTRYKHDYELDAISYVIDVLEFGKATKRGRPSNKALEYLARAL